MMMELAEALKINDSINRFKMTLFGFARTMLDKLLKDLRISF